MSLLYIFLIAVIQGLTEFLPVSSAGHLAAVPLLTGLTDQGLEIDVAVHVGTLGAVVYYFRDDAALALSGIGSLLTGQLRGPGVSLAVCLLIATVPVLLAGAAIRLLGVDLLLRSLAVIGWATLIFGGVLWWADRKGVHEYRAESWTLRDAVLMGLAQVLALVPGTSRAGITITAARWLGYRREEAARLSMLMSIPAILAAASYLGVESSFTLTWDGVLHTAVAVLASFGAAIVALFLMMRYLRVYGYTPYVIYRIGLGLVLLFIAYT